MDDPTAGRAGLHEAAFRRVNENIRSGTTVVDAEQPLGFVCECAVLGCTAIVELTLPEYEQVRADPRRFLTAEGHDLPEVERVVGRCRDHLVVEKVADEAVSIAEATDPRG